MTVGIAEPTRAQEVPHFHQGMIALYSELANRYGPASIRSASLAVGVEQEVGTFELYVPLDEMDEASIFAIELTINIEDQFNESYSVIVLQAAPAP